MSNSQTYVGEWSYFGLSPLPGCQSPPGLWVGDPNLNLHLPQLLGERTTQIIVHQNVQPFDIKIRLFSENTWNPCTSVLMRFIENQTCKISNLGWNTANGFRSSSISPIHKSEVQKVIQTNVFFFRNLLGVNSPKKVRSPFSAFWGRNSWEPPKILPFTLPEIPQKARAPFRSVPKALNLGWQKGEGWITFKKPIGKTPHAIFLLRFVEYLGLNFLGGPIEKTLMITCFWVAVAAVFSDWRTVFSMIEWFSKH